MQVEVTMNTRDKRGVSRDSVSPLTWTILTLCPPVQWQDSHEGCQTAQPQCSATRLWTAPSLNTFHPIAHNIPAAHELRQEQCSVCGMAMGPVPPSAEPRQPCPGDPGDGAGGAASPKPPPNSTQGFKKSNFFLQSVSNALCSLPTPRTPHLPLPNSRDCTWQQQQFTQSHFGSVSVP